MRSIRCCALLALAALAALPSSAAAWEPDPQRYGVAIERDVPVTMSDGVVLRSDVYRPADPATGAPADGRYPVVLQITPYGKADGCTTCVPPVQFASRGYITVVADARGTGASDGRWTFLARREAQDGVRLVRWAARLPGAVPRVGMIGGSALGIVQLRTAAAIGPRSPLKAIFPIVSSARIYQDSVAPGGLFNLALASRYNTVGALTIHDTGPISYELREHSLGGPSPTPFVVPPPGRTFGDDRFWRERTVLGEVDRIVANRVPAFVWNSWFDLWGQGDAQLYTALQNAAAGRPVAGPMAPRQRVSDRYQGVLGPYAHLDPLFEPPVADAITSTSLRWFDRWLKRRREAALPAGPPLHAYVLGGRRWTDLRAWPPPRARTRTLFLHDGGALSPARPPAGARSETLQWDPAASPCDRRSWVIPNPEGPCAADERPWESGALTWTTTALRRPLVVAGPMDLTLYARSSASETEWAVSLADVAPDGASRPLATGTLLGSRRAVDPRGSWRDPQGRMIWPYQPIDRGAVRAVPKGKVVRYDVALNSVLARLAPGHRLRIALRTSDFPVYIPPDDVADELAGSHVEVLHSRAAQSRVTFPVLPAMPPRARTWGPCARAC